MTQALETVELNTGITNDQLALIKKTVAQGFTNDELQLFFHQCNRYGVHPLDGLLHPSKFGGKVVFITSVALMDTRAQATGDYLGCSKPVWTGEPGQPGCKVEVIAKRLVKGHVAEHYGEAYWDEFCPPPGRDKFWKQFPHRMLPKCAKAQAMREGFPELSGLYVSEEMAQAKEDTYTEALTQDFPVATWINGVLVKVLPTVGATPTQLFIQTDNGTAQLSTFLPVPYCEGFIEQAIQYQFDKQGRLRVVTELRQQGQETNPLGSAATLAFDNPHNEPMLENPPREEEAEIIEVDDGMPGDEAFFAPDVDVRAVLVSFHEDETKTGKYVCRLVFECASGTVEVTAWDKAGKWDLNWPELLDKQVWFRAREGREYRGKPTYNLVGVSLYN
jgi:hypothetical protein